MFTFKNSYLSYFLMYGFYFLAWAMFSTLMSVYMIDMGYKPSQVSTLISISFTASLLSQPLIGWLNDRFSTKKVTFSLLATSLIGGGIMLVARDLLSLTVAYSLVVVMLNGCLPVMERIATQSPFAYGKIRVWGTVGFAVGNQLAGVVYERISPQAMFVSFIFGMLLCLLGILGTQPAEEEVKAAKKVKSKETLMANKPRLNGLFFLYLFFALVFTGIANTGHTYIPPMLVHNGLSIQWSTTVVAIAVLCEAPLTLLSGHFMDRLTSKKILGFVLLLVTVQFSIYALGLGLPSMVLVTLLTKHTSGILFIMVNMKIVASLVDKSYLITALSLVQAVRNLGSIIMQSISGQILDHTSYNTLCWLLAGLAFLLWTILRVVKFPDGTDQNLFRK